VNCKTIGRERKVEFDLVVLIIEERENAGEIFYSEIKIRKLIQLSAAR
jgi:hypothetical protein